MLLLLLETRRTVINEATPEEGERERGVPLLAELTGSSPGLQGVNT